MAVCGPLCPDPRERGRSTDHVQARHAAMWVAKKLAPTCTFTLLGKRFGGMHHSSAMHAIEKVDAGEMPAARIAQAALRLARDQERSRQDGTVALPVDSIRQLVNSCRMLEAVLTSILSGADPRAQRADTEPQQGRCMHKACAFPAELSGYCRHHLRMKLEPRAFQQPEGSVC
jgi:hypothetical protein